MDCLQVQRDRAPRGYRRREPERTLLYRVVAEHLESFLARARDADGSGLPRFVERELRAYLRCGVLAHGFVRVRCRECGTDSLVAFSCKGRAFCPCRGGRRMADTAAHLIDRVLPRVPVRQWVLTLPIRLRSLVAFDRELCRRLRNLFVRAVRGWLRRRAAAAGILDAETGAVTSVQRFGSALDLNLHFHSLVLDGVFHRDSRRGELVFRALPSPTEEELARLIARVRSRALALLRRRGLAPEDYRLPTDPLPMDSATLAACAAASVQRRVALGSLSGRPLPRRERLCRSVLRPPLSEDRLSLTHDGRVALELKTPYHDGATHFLFAPQTLLERLAALVPPPRAHLVVYHGVLSSAAAIRADVVPTSSPAIAAEPDAVRETRGRNDTWAELMKRVFLIDVFHCPCGGQRKILATITDPPVVRAILRALHLPEDPPPLGHARDPPWQAAIPEPLHDGPGPDSTETRLVLE